MNNEVRYYATWRMWKGYTSRGHMRNLELFYTARPADDME